MSSLSSCSLAGSVKKEVPPWPNRNQQKNRNRQLEEEMAKGEAEIKRSQSSSAENFEEKEGKKTFPTAEI